MTTAPSGDEAVIGKVTAGLNPRRRILPGLAHNGRVPIINVNLPRHGDDPDEPGQDVDLDVQYHAAVAKPDQMAWTPGPEHGLPATIRVGARTYEVRVFEPRDSEEWDALLGAEGGTAIWVRWPLGDVTRETLLHELLHAVDGVAETEAGETVVRAWAPVLLDALRANPELTAILLGNE